MTFQPIADYHSYNHILQAGAHWTHQNGNTYCCVCEQKAGARQNLCVYRMRPGADVWELVRRYQGTIDSLGHITMGGASIEPSGDMLVTTSLIIPGAQKVTSTGFEGCWIREANIDEPWSGGGGIDSAVEARIAALEARPVGVGPPGSGGVTLFPTPLIVAAWEGRILNGGVLVDVPAVFGCLSASAYLIRFVAQAKVADVRVRAGTSAAPYFLTLNLVVPNLQSHIQGWAPGPLMYVSTAQGEAKVWLQVLGSSG